MAEEKGYHAADVNGDGVVDDIEREMFLEFKRKELEDKDAQQVLYWLNGITFDLINVYVINDDGAQYTFDYIKSGYVKTDDWIDVDPDEFVRWTYAQALAHRQPRYANMAQNFGITVDACAWETITSEATFVDVIADALAAHQA